MEPIEPRCAGIGISHPGPQLTTMHQADEPDTPDAFDTGHVPDTIIDRETEQERLIDAFSGPGIRNLYLHGPRGTGKTLVARTALDALDDPLTTVHISCTQCDTQYRVLRRLYQALTGEPINHGYHTAQIQERIQDLVSDHDLVLVLDEIDFLLEHDGSDLLYFLSRMDANIGVVGISANYADPRMLIEERTLSSVQPEHLPFDRYPAEQAYDILDARLQDAGMADAVDRDALTYLVTQTTNIRLGLNWLHQAAATSTDRITVDVLRDVTAAAAQRYRDELLSGFGSHHQLLFEAVSQLATERDEAVRSGVLFDRYEELCQSTGRDALSNRQAGDHLTDLELLDIIDIDQYKGGEYGRTREIQLTEFL